MVDPRSVRFWQIATRCSLIDPAKLDECWNAIPAEKRTADAIDRRLARQAVNSGYLTLWQAQQMLAGRQHGLRIERYVLLDQIGHGGMGRVYLARDTRLGRHVALKVLSRERMSNPRALARFKREAKVGAQLQHENLVRIYDEGDIQGMPFLVMEYIVGHTVAHMIADQGRIEPELAAELGRQVALGLDHLHQKGLLHRDVNPTNILVDRGGTAKLTDLGLAIDLGDAEDIVTRDGATVGTFDYISPEQARNPRQIDTRSDIYSLGCTLYHMLTGRVPFPAPSLPEKLFAHQSKEPERLVGQVPGMPDALERIVLKMMSKKAEDRFARPSLVARALEAHARSARFAFDEPSTPPQRTPSSIILGDTVTRGGSDPDLAIVPSSTTERADSEGSSDPFAFVKIDFGAGEPLSETRTSARTHSQDRLGRLVHGRWPWIAAASLVVLVILGLVLTSQNGGGAGQPKEKEKPRSATNSTPAAVLASDIMVEYDDGTSMSAPNLMEAVRRAVGKQAKVVLRNQTPLTIGSSAPQQLRISSGRVVIEAAQGSHPMIEVLVNANQPAIVVAANSMLTLRGITLVAEKRLAEPSVPPAVIHATGNLRLEQCAVVVGGTAPLSRAILAEGTRLDVDHCFVRGFETPIVLSALSATDSEAKIEQSIVIGPIGSDSEAASTNGWTILMMVRPHARGPARPLRRQVTIEHCTFFGAGLVRFEGPVDKVAVDFNVSRTVVVARALAMWPQLPFPSLLVWNGRANCYSFTSDDLLLSTPGSTSGIPNAPKEWSTRGPLMESETSGRLVRFAVHPNGAGVRPADYRVVEPEQVDAGAAPSRSLLRPYSPWRSRLLAARK